VKIAVVTGDNEIISFHFNKASKYDVLTVDQGQIVSKEIRERTGRLDYQLERSKGQTRYQGDPGETGDGRHSGADHWNWLKLILDCKIVLALGMDQKAYIGLRCMGIQPFITNIPDIKSTAQAVIDGNIQNHLYRLD